MRVVPADQVIDVLGRPRRRAGYVTAVIALVVNHGISWNVVEKVRGTYEWDEPDSRAAYARDNGLDQIAMHPTAAPGTPATPATPGPAEPVGATPRLTG